MLQRKDACQRASEANFDLPKEGGRAQRGKKRFSALLEKQIKGSERREGSAFWARAKVEKKSRLGRKDFAREKKRASLREKGIRSKLPRG